MRRLLLATLTCLVLTGLSSAECSAQRLEAEALGGVHVKPAPNTSGGELGWLKDDSEIGSTTVEQDSTSLTLRARGGSPCSGVPHVSVALDGTVVLDTDLTTPGWTDYAVSTPVTVGQTLTVYGTGLDYSCNRVARLDFFDFPDVASPWRAFAPTSPWNIPAAQKGSIASSNPYASAMGSGDLEVTSSRVWSKPVYRAQPGDPTTTNVNLTTDWSPTGALKWDGGPIPIPAGCAPATGSDGHLLIISADRRISWEFWRATSCSPSGISAAVIAQFDLTGLGYDPSCDENSARGSGTPLIDTVVLNDDSFQHAEGFTFPSAGSGFQCPPATHSDGNGGGPQYGTLLVLRPDFPEAGNATTVNLIRELKTYGAYAVDQGAAWGVDAEPGSDLPSSIPIKPSDMRLVNTP